MPETAYLTEVVVILLAAVVAVTLFQRLRLGAVLGYLAAGALIGPSALALVSDADAIHSLAEIGIVLLLFTVGLELPLGRIRVMRSMIFGLGGAQVLGTGLAIAAVVFAFGGGPDTALVVGGGLALSSTAIVVRLLADGGELATRFGRTALAVLLMQDLAVAPLLVVIPVLDREPTLLAAAVGLVAVKAAIAVGVIVFLGRRLLLPLTAPVLAAKTPEIVTALTLLIVFCAAMATELAGLSMAFGAFLAGMMLADSRYRHQVAAEIEPFRGLLLGLFFITVGMSLDLALLGRRAGVVALVVAGLLFGKAVLLACLAWLFRLPPGQAVRLGILLSQGGEFAFVLLGAGMMAGVLSVDLGQLLTVAVAVTMILTPMLAVLARRLSVQVERSVVVSVEEIEALDAALTGHVIVAGFGRVGAAVAQQLAEAGQPFIAIDLDPHRVAEAAARDLPVYFGDATRLEVMEALHVERARSVVVALDNPRAALQLAATLRYIFPNLRVLARAYDETHAEELRMAGAHTVVPEPVAIGSSLAASILDPDPPADLKT